MFLKEKEVAEYLGASVHTVKHWRLYSGGGPPFTILRGHMVRYDKEALMKWLEEQQAPAKTG